MMKCKYCESVLEEFVMPDHWDIEPRLKETLWCRHCGFTQVIIREWWTWKELESWEVVENRKEDSYFVSNSVYNSP